MYKINKEQNDITKIEEKQFSDLKIREREHLQEWIAKNPEILGEDLLIIQKEFQGFNETRERLDLLALDKAGSLVVIENKLDDSGRDVVWQALKYASYCSTLTTEQIISIYHQYLTQYDFNGTADTNIRGFLELGENDDLLLNIDDLRIMFVANQYRKEVTSTVLWLIDHDINIQCFRVQPFQSGPDLFLQVDQIIPLPETKEFIINLKEKEKETKEARGKQQDNLLLWKKLKSNLEKDGIDYLDTVPAQASSNLNFTREGAMYGYCLGWNKPRVELYFGSDKDKSKYGVMYRYKNEIETQLGRELEFEKMASATRIKVEMNQQELDQINGDWKDKSNWDYLINWFSTEMVRLYSAIHPYWLKAKKDL